MEADSTTYDKNTNALADEPILPFKTHLCNFRMYKELTIDNGAKIIERMQYFSLLPRSVKCPSNKPDCKVICKPARVVDRVQWVCEGCGKRQSIRDSTFYFRLHCSLMQGLQIILAWCEDIDLNVAAEHFGVKLKVACHIFDKLDELAIKEYNKHQLGGDNSVVLAELYPDCLNRLSPDTTEQPHVHRILMLADTNHIPTYYKMHIIKENHKKHNGDSNQVLKTQLEEIIARSVKPGSMVVAGNSMPPIDGASHIQQLTPHCDIEMEHFLSTRIWRQAITLCSAARELCARAAGAGAGACAGAVQRYLHAALYRVRHNDGFYPTVLTKLAEDAARTYPTEL